MSTRVTIVLSDYEYHRWLELAEGMDFSELIRRSVDAYCMNEAGTTIGSGPGLNPALTLEEPV